MSWVWWFVVVIVIGLLLWRPVPFVALASKYKHGLVDPPLPTMSQHDYEYVWPGPDVDDASDGRTVHVHTQDLGPPTRTHISGTVYRMTTARPDRLVTSTEKRRRMINVLHVHGGDMYNVPVRLNYLKRWPTVGNSDYEHHVVGMPARFAHTLDDMLWYVQGLMERLTTAFPTRQLVVVAADAAAYVVMLLARRRRFCAHAIVTIDGWFGPSEQSTIRERAVHTLYIRPYNFMYTASSYNVAPVPVPLMMVATSRSGEGDRRRADNLAVARQNNIHVDSYRGRTFWTADYEQQTSTLALIDRFISATAYRTDTV